MPKGIHWLPLDWDDVIADDLGPDCPIHGIVHWWCDDETNATDSAMVMNDDLAENDGIIVHDHAHTGLIRLPSRFHEAPKSVIGKGIVAKCPVGGELWAHHYDWGWDEVADLG